MAMQATKVEKVLEERRILDKADQEVQKFIQTHTRTFVNTAMNNSTMTYGAYMWGIEKSKQSIRTKIENILEQFNIKKSTPIRRKRCAECSNIIRRSAEFDKIVSSILSNESISNRLMMKLFANDTVDKETTNVSIYSFEIPLDDLRVLYKQLDSKSNDDVTKLYQNYLLSKMENLSMAESTFQDFLTQGYINPLDDPALMAQLEEISIQSSNHQCKSTKAKNKKNKQTNLKHQQTKQSPKTGRGDKVASESTETYNYNIQQELIELAQSSYGLDPRVRKWSKPLDKLLGYFKNPKSSYDAQFTEINKDRNRVMEEKIRHDIIPIQYLLDRPDATNYFITKGNTRSAAVRLEVGHARKEYGMVDITIDTTDEKPVIYHQMFRKAKPEETLRFFAPNVGDKDNVEEDDNYVYEGRSIVKNISNQSYIITIPDGDAKLSKKLYVLPYRLNSALG